MSERIEADADVAARYLKALIARGIERAEAVQLTSNYVTMRMALASSGSKALLGVPLPKS